MTSQAPNYHGYRFPPEIISHAVWLYHRFWALVHGSSASLRRALHQRRASE